MCKRLFVVMFTVLLAGSILLIGCNTAVKNGTGRD